MAGHRQKHSDCFGAFSGLDNQKVNAHAGDGHTDPGARPDSGDTIALLIL